jgi:protein-tyrosine-phosphatase
MVEKADAIFVMDYLNEAGLLGKFPKAWKKLYMLGSFTTGEKREKIEIEDPYNGDIDDIRRCYKTLRSAVQNLVMNIT